jgi:hypothetical protein
MNLIENVAKLSRLITELNTLKDAVDVANTATTSYAKVSISNNGNNWRYLEQILTLPELVDITSYIHDKLLEKQRRLEDELNSHVIAKQV